MISSLTLLLEAPLTPSSLNIIFEILEAFIEYESPPWSKIVAPFLSSMATWDLGILIVTVLIALGVAADDTCIRAPAAAKIPLIVGSSEMGVVAEAGWD